MGCFLYDTPEMVTLRNINKFRANYPVEAKKNHAKFTVVLDTPEYQRVTELKTHMSNLIYKYHAKQEMSKIHMPLNNMDIERVKWAQQLSNKFAYASLAAKERASFTPDSHTPANVH